MGNDEAGAPAEHGLDGILDELLRFRIDGGGCLVQHEDGRVGQNRTGKGNQLLLTSGEAIAALTDVGVKAVLHGENEVLRTDHAGSSLHLLQRRVRAAVADVVRHRAGEQVGRLQHIAQIGLKPQLAAGAIIRAVNQNPTGSRFVEAADQIDDGGLAGAGFADKCDGLAMIDMEVEVLKHLLAILIAEGDVLKVDVADKLGPVFLLGMEIVAEDGLHLGAVNDIRFGFQQGNHAFCRGLGGLQLREDAGDIAHRLEEADGVVDKHLQRADGHHRAHDFHAMDDGRTALPQRIGGAKRADRHHNGQEQRAQRRRTDGGLLHVGRNSVELLNVEVFTHKGLGGLCAVDALIEAGGNL